MGYRTRLVACVVGLLTALAVAAPAAAQSNTSTDADTVPVRYCDVRITGVNSWSGGYTVSISVQNISDVPVVVSASVPIPPPDLILQAWNVMVTTSGSTAWLRPWNPILQPGQTLYFGYLGMGRYVPPTVVCQPLS